ncbi:LacI family DNA-binding transcriptional regulator [Pararhodobacter sp.]|uniref:LacI family DNA-binding transcriptional regulator n=1 Tax=Pararhodobacter sp. TaxID=2127056 RepID=UPI002AFE66E9|nr:LacI family DNA-binding transcriptional regulator [Pararhodobacter sp.]
MTDEPHKVTSVDVARLAGVSQSAVSRVFTSGASASKKTKDKVLKAATTLGYRPNVLARAMITGRSRIIGLVVAYLENQFYPLALERLSNALQAKGYHILIFTAPNSAEDVEAVIQDLMAYQIDALIAASVSITSELAEQVRKAGIPVVLFNRGQDGVGVSSVTSANLAGGRKVARFLLEGGHERIGHIAGWQGSSTGRDRQSGFLAEMNAAGRTPFSVMDGMYSRDEAMACAEKMLAGPVIPDAIFVGNDHMAFGVMDVVRAHGLVPGHSISVVGYDDVPLAEWGGYHLTTIRQPVNRMVESTVNLMLRMIEDADAMPEHIEVEGPLIVRSSARIPEGWTK